LDQHAIGPDVAGIQREGDVSSRIDDGLGNLEAVGFRGRDGGNRAHPIARSGLLPMIGDARLRQPVGIDQQFALLRQNAVEVIARMILPT